MDWYICGALALISGPVKICPKFRRPIARTKSASHTWSFVHLQWSHLLLSLMSSQTTFNGPVFIYNQTLARQTISCIAVSLPNTLLPLQEPFYICHTARFRIHYGDEYV